MYGCRRFRIPVLRNGRPCWQVVVRVAADVGARWCAKGAKASPAWAPWPCLRSAMALRIVFIWAWPLAARFGRPSVRGGHSHCAGCARSDALAVASSAPPGAPRAGLAGTLVAPPPAGALGVSRRLYHAEPFLVFAQLRVCVVAAVAGYLCLVFRSMS